MPEFSPKDLDDLRNAKKVLEHPSFAARVSNLVGTPIEKMIEALPINAKEIIAVSTNKALEMALQVAISTMADGKQSSWNWGHTAAIAASGALGGAFGLPALTVELPISTTIMLRSIADVARSEGEDIASPEGKLACLVVFAFGGPGKKDDAVESGYFAVRSVLATAIREAAQHLATHGFAKEAAPPLLRFLAEIGTRFGIQVTEKAMAQALPIIGAAGGALLNTLFIDHFQTIARGHFVIRRLERTYGEEAVKTVYDSLPND